MFVAVQELWPFSLNRHYEFVRFFCLCCWALIMLLNNLNHVLPCFFCRPRLRLQTSNSILIHSLAVSIAQWFHLSIFLNKYYRYTNHHHNHHILVLYCTLTVHTHLQYILFQQKTTSYFSILVFVYINYLYVHVCDTRVNRKKYFYYIQHYTYTYI